jgi:hypothetical protein
MNKKMVVFLVLVLAVLAFSLFNPYVVKAAEPKQYKTIWGSARNQQTVSDFEQKVSAELNDGWSLAGGVASVGATSIAQALVK